MERGFNGLLSGLRAGASAWSCGTAWSCWACSSRCWSPTIQMFGIVPKGFIPEQDNDR